MLHSLYEIKGYVFFMLLYFLGNISDLIIAVISDLKNSKFYQFWWFNGLVSTLKVYNMFHVNTAGLGWDILMKGKWNRSILNLC